MSGKIRLIIADDHDVLRYGLRISLETVSDIELIAEARDGEEAIRLCEQYQPDILLFDLHMPRTKPPETIRTLKRLAPYMRIVVLTTYVEYQQVRAVMQAGVDGYLVKDANFEELLYAIDDVVNGKFPLSDQVRTVLFQSRPISKPQLTKREHEVLSLVVTGMTNREIAEQLLISDSTAKNHISNIFHKLEIKSRAEAVAYALQNNLIS